MVHSMTYILNDLRSRIEKKKESLEKIEDSKSELQRQAEEAEMEIDSQIAGQLEALHERKECLLVALNEISDKETQSLFQKSLQVEENVGRLCDLLSMGEEAGDNREFRDLYEKTIDGLAVGEEMEVNNYEVNFYADCQPLKDTINQFGTISLERKSDPGSDTRKPFSSSLHDWYTVDGFDSSKENDNGNEIFVKQKADKKINNWKPQLIDFQESKQEEDEKCKKEKNCELKGCCNCVDVCEETLLPIKKMKISSNSQVEDLQKWLIKGKTAISSSSDLPFSLQKLVDNQVLTQLESLKLSDDHIEADGFKKQINKNDTAIEELQEKLNNWRFSQQKNYPLGIDEKPEGTKVAFLEEWDRICERPLSTWLKATVLAKAAMSSKDNSKPKEGHVRVLSEICSSPLQYWLKEDKVMDIEDIGAKSTNNVSPSIKHCDAVCNTSLFYWLKQNNPMLSVDSACRRNCTTSEKLKEVENIQNSPLRSWLKVELKSSTGGMPVKGNSPACKDPEFSFPRNARTESLETATVKELHKITSSALSNWLKRDVLHQKAGACSSMSVNPRKRGVQPMHNKSSGNISKAELSHWLKKPPVASYPQKADLHKWLVN